MSPTKILPKGNDDLFPTPLGFQSGMKHIGYKPSSAVPRMYERGYDPQSNVPPSTPKHMSMWEARLHSQQNSSQMPAGLIVQSVAVPGKSSVTYKYCNGI